MDDRRFDNLARLLAGAGWSRRGLARVLTGAVLTPVLGLGFAAETDARKKGKGKGKKKKKKNQPPPPPPGCNGDCTGKACLADDGCGAPCLSGSCPGTDVCTTGGCVSPGCGPGKRDCGGGVCIPDGDLSCCNQAEGRCGASSSANDLLCNPDTNRCECYTGRFEPGLGICSRTLDGGGTCHECCPGGRSLGQKCGTANGEFVCISQTNGGCGCPSPKVACPGTSQKCSDNLNTDSKRCGPNCEDCTLTNKTCCSGECVYLGGCQPGDSSGCFNARCGSCDNVCGGDTPLCCDQDGPSGVCVLAQFCPFPP